MDKTKNFNMEIIATANDLLSKINQAEGEVPRSNEKLLNLFKECCDLFSKDSELFRTTYCENKQNFDGMQINDNDIENIKLLLDKTINIYAEF